MKPSRIDQLSDAPVIGQRYRVPCFTASRFGGAQLPVLGTAHRDPELFPAHRPDATKLHYHLDFRFLSDALIERVFGYPAYSLAVTLPTLMGRVYEQEDGDNGILLPLPTPTWRIKMCVRAMPTFPCVSRATFEKTGPVTVLEPLFCKHRIDPANPICPHRGIALRGLPVNDDNCVTCPGHGLRWSLSTGEMVPR